jgi:hypothetical protein
MNSALLEQTKITKTITDPINAQRPLSPGWLIVVSMLGGGIAAGCYAGMILKQYGKTQQAVITASVTVTIGLIFLILCTFWETDWYWTSLAMQLVHATIGIALFLFIKNACKKIAPPPKRSSTVRSGFSREIAGAGAGFILMLFFAPICTAVYIFGMDQLFSNYISIAADNSECLLILFAYVSLCTIAGIFGGGIWVRLRNTTQISDILTALACYFIAFFSLAFGLEITMVLPSFQAASASGKDYMGVVGPIVFIQVLFNSWWSILLAYYITAPDTMLPKLKRISHAVVLQLSISIVLSISLGGTTDLFLFLGKAFERQAHIKQALYCYEKGLTKKPNEKTAGWMQFQVAMLNYKKGELNAAQDGFRRVVAKYNEKDELTKKAGYFLQRLKSVNATKRIVLPGIETRTKYRGTYCVPNSLALVMRHWGMKVNAGEIGSAITGLSKGTYTVDQAWFAYDKGLRHDFLPLAELDDIKKCIDAGFPVMVYVPMHVFVIFGYDETLSTFVTYDVATHDIWVDYIQNDFVKSWKRQASTLVLVYPDDKKENLPVSIRTRMQELSNNYLHFEAHFFDTLSSRMALGQLMKAAGSDGKFFHPIITMYNEYPGLRDSLNHRYDSSIVAQSIYNFFSRNYDEGTHLWGQINDEDYAYPDWALQYAVNYLIGTRQFAVAESLITGIGNKGQVSAEMVALNGMIDIATGRLVQGLDRIKQSESSDFTLYKGLADLKLKNQTEAAGNFADELANYMSNDDQEYSSDKPLYTLDRFGYPSFALANELSRNLPTLGESRKVIVSGWENLIYTAPFDSATAAVLSAEYSSQLQSLKKDDDPYKYEQIKVKKSLMEERKKRYSLSSF